MAHMSNCLRNLRARRLLLALGLAGLAGLAQGADRSHQREQFRQAMDAARQGRAWKAYAADLGDYPLLPWLEQAALLRRLDQLDTAAVQDFGERWPDSLAASDLRGAFLRELARRQQWRDFLALYRAERDGSSRELARMLAAQKNWDKNFDLSRQDAPTEGAVQPEIAGRSRSKGKIIMFIAVPIAAIGLVAAATDWSQQAAPVQPVAAAATAQDPLVGKWSLDVSRIPANERPRRVTIAFRVMPDRKWNTQVEIVAPDGSTTQAESTAALDGVPVPVTGIMAFIDAVSLRQPEANTLVMTLNKNGAPVSTRVYTISRDRQSMTETIVWPGSDEPRMVTTYFNRID